MKYFVKEGERYSRLVVLVTQQRLKGKYSLYNLCQCDCGKKTYRTSRQLVLGLRKSCGCGYRERLKRGNFIHGGTLSHQGKVNFTYLYTFWTRVRRACLNPKDRFYAKLGKKGVSLAPEWREDYPAFRDWIKKNLGARPSVRHRLERFEAEKGFEPGNLVWTTSRDMRALRKEVLAFV